MPAPYQRHHATGSQGGDGPQASLRPVGQWGVETDVAGSCAHDEGLFCPLPAHHHRHHRRPHDTNGASVWGLMKRRIQ